MELIKKVEETTNYELLVVRYFDDRIKDNVLSYAVRNKNHGVMEYTSPGLLECQTTMEHLEEITYPVKTVLEGEAKQPLMN